MSEITLNSVVDTFVSENQPTTNFNRSLYLATGGNTLDKYKSLFKFNLKKLYSIKSIKDVHLKLFVNDVIFSTSNSSLILNVFNNNEEFYEDSVTWDKCPRVDYKVYSFEVKDLDKNSYISIDISAIVFDWINQNINNYGITVVGDNNLDLAIFDSTGGLNEPVLVVNY